MLPYRNCRASPWVVYGICAGTFLVGRSRLAAVARGWSAVLQWEGWIAGHLPVGTR